MIRVNKNILQLKPSATLAINQSVNALRGEGKEIYHFGFGQSPFPIHASIVDALKNNAANNHYLPTLGLEKLRMQLALFLTENQNINSDPNFLYIGPGSKELLYQTILILKSTFLIPKGSWVSYGPQIKSTNGNFVVLETYLKDDFKVTAEVLEAYCKVNIKQQKALILNSPNNPTGAVYTSKELEDLAVICREYEIIVLSDEIYSQINFNENCSPSISTFYPEKTIVFGGLSKVFSAGGYRLGFMALPVDLQFLHNTYCSLFSETFSAVSSPIQFAAVEAYKMTHEVKNHIKDCSQILKGISDFVYSELKTTNIECTIPQGAFYMMIGFNNYKQKINKLDIKTNAQLADYMLGNFKVALLPGSDFYFKDEALFFRLAFVDFNGEEVLKAYKKSKLIDAEFIQKYCPNIFKGTHKIIEFVGNLL